MTPADPTAPPGSLQYFGIALDIITGDIPQKNEIIIKENIDIATSVLIAKQTVEHLRNSGIMDTVWIKVVSDTKRSVVRVVG